MDLRYILFNNCLEKLNKSKKLKKFRQYFVIKLHDEFKTLIFEPNELIPENYREFNYFYIGTYMLSFSHNNCGNLFFAVIDKDGKKNILEHYTTLKKIKKYLVKLVKNLPNIKETKPPKYVK